MINEAYVSFEVAKLLKEKGFDEPCFSFYQWYESGVTLFKGYLPEYSNSCSRHNNKSCDIISRPMQAMAMAWLREEKNIDIFPWLYYKDFEGKLTYSVSIYDHGCEITIPGFYDEKYENIIEEALRYTLENLI